MKVSELISQLNRYPQGHEVYIMLSGDGDSFCPVGDIDKDGEAVWFTGAYSSDAMLTYGEMTGQEDVDDLDNPI